MLLLLLLFLLFLSLFFIIFFLVVVPSLGICYFYFAQNQRLRHYLVLQQRRFPIMLIFKNHLLMVIILATGMVRIMNYLVNLMNFLVLVHFLMRRVTNLIILVIIIFDFIHNFIIYYVLVIVNLLTFVNCFIIILSFLTMLQMLDDFKSLAECWLLHLLLIIKIVIAIDLNLDFTFETRTIVAYINCFVIIGFINFKNFNNHWLFARFCNWKFIKDLRFFVSRRREWGDSFRPLNHIFIREIYIYQNWCLSELQFYFQLYSILITVNSNLPPPLQINVLWRFLK